MRFPYLALKLPLSCTVYCFPSFKTLTWTWLGRLGAGKTQNCAGLYLLLYRQATRCHYRSLRTITQDNLDLTWNFFSPPEDESGGKAWSAPAHCWIMFPCRVSQGFCHRCDRHCREEQGAQCQTLPVPHPGAGTQPGPVSKRYNTTVSTPSLLFTQTELVCLQKTFRTRSGLNYCNLWSHSVSIWSICWCRCNVLKQGIFRLQTKAVTFR